MTHDELRAAPRVFGRGSPPIVSLGQSDEEPVAAVSYPLFRISK